MQHPALRADSSVVGPYLRVRVRGCPWWSVAVDVPIDVGQGAPRSRALISCMYAARVSPPQPDSSRCRWHHRSCAPVPVWHPVDLAQPNHMAVRGQPSMESTHLCSRSAPGLLCGSPGGRSTGCHTLSTQPSPARAVGRPSRRSACPARACFVWTGAAVADVARLGERRSGLRWSGRPVAG